MLINLTVTEILAYVVPNDKPGTDVADWSTILEWKPNSENFDGLAMDILTNGFSPAAPLLLREIDGVLTLLDGHHRFSISVLLGLDSVPVYVAGLGTGGMLEATADFGPRPTTKARR